MAAEAAVEQGRFRLRRQLGAGGMGVVHEAYDTLREAVVAVKVLRQVDPAGIYRFKKEFRALADVRHRNLVTLYELVAEGDQWFLSMELIDGVDILSFVRDGSSPGRSVTTKNAPHAARRRLETPASLVTNTLGTIPNAGALSGAPADTVSALAWLGESLTCSKPTVSLNSSRLGNSRRAAHGLRAPLAPPLTSKAQFERLRDGLGKIVEAAMAVHAGGYVHGDLKPSNVMVDNHGRVVVLDFGIVRELWAGAAGKSTACTPSYAAPEISTELPTGEASDWYAVGIMLFQALTGELPFVGNNREVTLAKQSFAAPSSRERAPAAPEALHDLCADLLDRDPDRRPGGREILKRLGLADVDSHLISAARGGTALVGREAELTQLRAHLAQAATGLAQTAMVHGSSGVGKTALVGHFLREVTANEEALVLSGRCYQSESVPHKALDSVIDALARHLTGLSDQLVEELVPDTGAALARMFPVLAQIAAISPAPKLEEGGDAHELRRRACTALRTILDRLAQRAPIVLYIDDAQWGDVDSARFLTDALRPPQAPAVLLVLSYRTDEAGASPFLQTIGESLSSQFEVAVQPLGEASGRELAEQLLLELNADPGLAPVIAREAEGSPFFIAELARYSAAQARAELGALRLRDLVRDRVADLLAPARALLEVLAVAGQPITRALVLRAADLGERGYAAAQTLRSTQLARSSGAHQSERLETYHDRIRETVVAGLEPDRLRACHRALASALESARPGDAETLAQHWDGAGEPERAADCYAEAGDRAVEALAFDRAAALFDRSLVLAPRQGEARIELLGKLGYALAAAGRGGLAAVAYRQAASEAEGDIAIGYHSRAAGQLLRGGHIDEGLDAMGDVLRALRAPFPRTRVGLLASLVYGRLRIRLRGFEARETTGAAQSGARQRLDLYFHAMTALGFIDPVRAMALGCRYVRNALDSGDPSHVGRALAAEANFLAFVGPQARARCSALSNRAHALADQHSDSLLKGYACYSVALCHYQCGELAAGRDNFYDAAVNFRRAPGGWWEACIAEEGILWCLSYLGETATLVFRLQALLREADDRGDLYFATNLCMGKPSLAWLVRDDLEGARAASRRALASWTVRGYQRQHVNALLSDTNANLYSDDGAEAWRNLNQQWRALASSSAMRIMSMRTESWHLRARAALAAAATSPRPQQSDLLRQATVATRRVAREPTIFARALVPLQQAGIAHLRGDDDGAAEHLRDAIAACGAADLKLYAASAERQLGLLLGGDEGRALVDEADARMRSQEIVDPARMAAVFAPGF